MNQTLFPQLRHSTADSGCDIIFAHYNESVPASFEDYAKPSASVLPDWQVRKWKSRRIAHFLLYLCLTKYHLDPTLLDNIIRTPTGRPYLADDRIDFNISHSGDWVIVIFSFSPDQPKRVGIDIEHPQKTRRYLDLLHHYATKQEIHEIQNFAILPELTTLSQRFYLSWCLREAILKSQGVGIVKLREVQHTLSTQHITSAYAPTGKLCFHFQLPFYLAYFVEQSASMLSFPTLFQWKSQQLIPLTSSAFILYQVN